MPRRSDPPGAQFAGLVNRRIDDVRYFEPHIADLPEPRWGAGVFDALDFGLEIDLDDATTWSFIWYQAGTIETLLAYPGTLAAQLGPDADPAVWDVTDRWRTLGPASIASVQDVRGRHSGADVDHTRGHGDHPGEPEDDLVTLILTSPSQDIAIITLGDCDSDGAFHYSHDTVAVFFSLEEARKTRMLLPGHPDAIVQTVERGA